MPSDSHFVLAGDLNADPNDGDSRDRVGAKLLEHELVNDGLQPGSLGAREAAAISGGANQRHTGNSALDTADWPDERIGNLRVDYVLPGKSLRVVKSGVFWPGVGEQGSELAKVSDHRLVWIDIQLGQQADRD